MAFTVFSVVLAALVLIIILGLAFKARAAAGTWLNIGLKLLTAGAGWVPLLVLTIHLFCSQVLHLYQLWPPVDIPMHFSGGVAIAIFVSHCFQLLPREQANQSRVALLELVLIGSLTASAAAFWEFFEFTFDRVFGTNVQISLANTMQDMAMGILGALVFSLIRIRQLHVGMDGLRELAFDWMHGQTA